MVTNPDPPPRPEFSVVLRFWLKLGFISFGGPAGQIAIMHAELVEKRRWISEERFLQALNFCLLLPGPEAQQLATYMGWLLHGVRGGVAAGVLFILPAVVLLWALSWLFMSVGNVPWIAAIFYGLQPAVMAIVAAAVLRIGSKTLRTPFLCLIAVTGFAAIFFFKISFPVLLLGAAVAGWLAGRFRPGWLPKEKPAGETGEEIASSGPTSVRGSTRKIVLVCLILWAVPVAFAGVVFGWTSVYARMALFFSKTALFTFGGAYAVLPYVAQQVVENYRWLSTIQMMSGLALAETTPGPLIMVLQFVGFAGAWQNPGALPPLLAGTLGAAITTWVTFLPSFLFVLAGAPHIEQLHRLRGLAFGLSGITAAVVGVILNLAVWFGLHTILPASGKPDLYALALAVVFFLGLWKGRWSVLLVVVAGALLGLIGKLVLGV